MSEPLIAEMSEHTRSLISSLWDNVAAARGLREASFNLRCDNSDLREFLREKLLVALNKQDDWMERRSSDGSV